MPVAAVRILRRCPVDHSSRSGSACGHQRLTQDWVSSHVVPAKCGGEDREYSQGEHCCRDVICGRWGYCRGSAVEYEQPRPGDLARESFAVADREERVAATVHHPPATAGGPAVTWSEPRAQP